MDAAVPIQALHMPPPHKPAQRGPPFSPTHPRTSPQAARLIRPVRQIASGAAEMLGTLEQNNMSIRVPDGGEGGTKGLKFTHAGAWRTRGWGGVMGVAVYRGHGRPRSQMRCMRPCLALPPTSCAHLPPAPAAEFATNSMLSVVASLTPYSDFNQSPRNMYQCQMAKQTMGTPAQVRWGGGAGGGCVEEAGGQARSLYRRAGCCAPHASQLPN